MSRKGLNPFHGRLLLLLAGAGLALSVLTMRSATLSLSARR